MEESENVSYIIIHDLTPEAKMLYLSPSLTEVLGFEPSDVIGTSSFDWMHPDEVDTVKQLHYDTIREDKAAAVAYLRVKNQDDRYVPCVIQRSMVHNALIGSISFAKPGAKALHTAATAQEVTICTPVVKDMGLEFRKWNERGPRHAPPPSIPANMSYNEMFQHLPTPSLRTGMILNRFSRHCPVMYCTNDCLIPSTKVYNRSFYDFVSPEDEAAVRQWIEVSKGWGVTDTGTPSDGGFVFGSFKMCLQGRDSAEGHGRAPRNRRNGASRRDRESRDRDGRERNRDQPSQEEQQIIESLCPESRNDLLLVDAIFSAHSDGFIVILRKADATNSDPIPQHQQTHLESVTTPVKTPV